MVQIVNVLCHKPVEATLVLKCCKKSMCDIRSEGGEYWPPSCIPCPVSPSHLSIFEEVNIVGGSMGGGGIMSNPFRPVVFNARLS